MLKQIRKVLAALSALFLLSAFMLWYGVQVLNKGNKGEDLAPQESLVWEILRIDQTLKRFWEEPSTLKELQTGPQAPAALGDFVFLQDQAIHLPYCYLFSYRETDYLKAVLWDLDKAKALQSWAVSIDTLAAILAFKKKTDEMLSRNPKRHTLIPLFLHAPRLLPNSRDIVASFDVSDGQFLIRINPQGRVEWVSEKLMHHSIEIGPSGNIWACGKRPSPVDRPIDPGKTSTFDYKTTQAQIADETICAFDPQTGNLIYEKSIREIVLSCPALNSISLHPLPAFWADPYHLNDVEPVAKDSRKGYWKKGDLLVSLRNTNTVLLYRPQTDSVLWHRSYPWLMQHDVAVLNDSSISVFDNRCSLLEMGYRNPPTHSRCMVYDFALDEVSSYKEPVFEEFGAFTSTQGRAEIKDGGLLYAEITDQAYFLLAGKQMPPTKVYLRDMGSDRPSFLSWYKLYADSVWKD